jgi:hypothetical protein
MPDQPKPLTHYDVDLGDDEALSAEARTFLAKTPAVQLVAELYAKLRSLHLPWWSPEELRATWSARTRMRWLRQRADIRQAVTTRLTGLPPNAARKKAPDFQAELIDAVIDDGDVRHEAFEDAFEPIDIAVYGPVVDVWTLFRDRMPWEDDSATHQKLFAWLVRALLTERSGVDGTMRRPILTAWDVRSGIDPVAWHTRLPLEVRLAIDDARLKHEKTRPREGFVARHELAIAGPDVITQHLPLAALTGIVAAAEKAMGFDISTSSSQRPSGEYEVGEPPLSSVA